MFRIASRIAGFSGLMIGVWCSHWASAQTYPSKPIRLIVPYVTGAVLDATARAVGQQVSESLGQPVIVENRPGASSIVGMEACAKAAPDGYTLCITVADSLSYNPYLFANLPYNPETDFVPVINLVRGNSMILANATAPFNSFKEMVEYSRANPGALNWGTWGPATIPDVYLQWIKHQKGVNITAVPYKGGGQAIPALLAGEINVTFMAIGVVLPQIKAGKLKSIAVVGSRRSPLLPEVPSLAEEDADPGLNSYFGVFAPVKTPRPIVERLNSEFTKALQAPKIQDFMRTQTLTVVGGSASEFAEFLTLDRTNSGRVFKTIGVRAESIP